MAMQISWKRRKNIFDLFYFDAEFRFNEIAAYFVPTLMIFYSQDDGSF